MNIHNFKEVGETFTFLGTNCIVINIDTDDYAGNPPRPIMTAMYTDSTGKFHTQVFNDNMLIGLRKENNDPSSGNGISLKYCNTEIIKIVTTARDSLLPNPNIHLARSDKGSYEDGVKALFHSIHQVFV